MTRPTTLVVAALLCTAVAQPCGNAGPNAACAATCGTQSCSDFCERGDSPIEQCCGCSEDAGGCHPGSIDCIASADGGGNGGNGGGGGGTDGPCGADSLAHELLNNGCIPLLLLVMAFAAVLLPLSHHVVSWRTCTSLALPLASVLLVIVLLATSKAGQRREVCDEATGTCTWDCGARNETSARVLVVIIPQLLALAYKGWQWRVLTQRRAVLEGGLLRELSGGSIRLHSIDWLLAQPDRYVLCRRQALPEGALVPAAQAAALFRAGKVAVLSYRWLTAAHPDPDAFHMRAVRTFLRGQPTRWAAVFWDFASCHQKERTDDEAAAFKAALSVMIRLYASPVTTVMQHKRLPTGFPPEQPTYATSGWCTMEQAAASLATESGGTLHELGTGWVRLARGQRRSPEEMAAVFADERRTKFVGTADRATVAQMYADLHTAVVMFDEQTMPILTRLIDTHLYATRRRAVPAAVAVALLCVGGALGLGIAFLSHTPPQPGMLIFAVVLFGLVLPCGLCLPSRIVRARLGGACGAASTGRMTRK
jgi:hypothetical protein